MEIVELKLLNVFFQKFLTCVLQILVKMAELVTRNTIRLSADVLSGLKEKHVTVFILFTYNWEAIFGLYW